MDLATLIAKYRGPLQEQYADRLLPSHRRALDAITGCRTPAAGEVLTRCTDCHHIEWHPCSCGHRSCPKCQNHDATRWLQRQRDKLLPVEYFLVTFTLPAQLRSLAWNHQRKVYDAMFAAARQTIQDFGHNRKHLGADIGCTMLFHSHSRRILYHPHLHVIVPGGGVDSTNQWKRPRGKYLFPGSAMAIVFRGKLYHELEKRGLKIPANVPKKWVVDCRSVGRGDKALEYLSRYLYRGVISEANILFEKDGQVTFRYTDWQAQVSRTETLPGAEFLWRIIQHVLPKGFHRVRDYGLLHHSAKKKRRMIQYLLGLSTPTAPPAERPSHSCSACGGAMKTVVVYRPHQVPLLLEIYSAQQEGLAC